MIWFGHSPGCLSRHSEEPDLSRHHSSLVRRGLAAGAVTLLSASVAAPSASAACAAPAKGTDAITEATQAKTAFVGVARVGDTLSGSDTLITPATFDVQYRLSGRRTGATEQVATEALSANSVVSEGIGPAAGEQWLIAGSPTAQNPVIAAACSRFARQVDTTKAPVVTVKGTTLTAVLSDLRGRPVMAGVDAPVLPRRTVALALPGAEAARLVRAGRITRLTQRNGMWRLTGVKRGDRIFWLDPNGLWAVRAG